MMAETLLPRRPGKRILNEDGSALVEFAFIAPVLMLILIALFDFGHTTYMHAALQGAVQKAGRDGAIQNSTTAQIDAAVRSQLRELNSAMAAPQITRRFFRDYEAAAARRFEPYTDDNGNNRCDNSEPYTDENWNSAWDADGADAGQGGAQDRTVYTVRVSYPRMLPLHRFIGGPPNITLVATTVLANQPYANQAQYAANPPSRNCS